MTSLDPNASWRIVIVDDEPLARSGLAAAIGRVLEASDLPPLQVVALCEDAVAGQR